MTISGPGPLGMPEDTKIFNSWVTWKSLSQPISSSLPVVRSISTVIRRHAVFWKQNPLALKLSRKLHSLWHSHLSKIQGASRRSYLLVCHVRFWNRILCKHGWRQSLYNRMILSPPLTSSLPTGKFREEDMSERPILVLFVKSLSAP